MKHDLKGFGAFFLSEMPLSALHPNIYPINKEARMQLLPLLVNAIYFPTKKSQKNFG
jgi:hypothetical protein